MRVKVFQMHFSDDSFLLTPNSTLSNKRRTEASSLYNFSFCEVVIAKVFLVFPFLTVDISKTKC